MNNLMNQLPYNFKAAVDKVKAAVYQYSPMEAKVREATNNDHWGASSTLLLEISKATYTFQQFNEVMPLLYRRINESQGSWRETYKTLQLIDYLLKNGAEQVIENVRDHLYEIKSLTNYQFTDEKGKDQGINVRHRAKEIIELVEDLDRLKDERAKAETNRNKYKGTSSEEAKYGGFSSESFKSSSVQGYSDKGGLSFSSDNYNSYQKGGNAIEEKNNTPKITSHSRKESEKVEQPTLPTRSAPTVKMDLGSVSVPKNVSAAPAVQSSSYQAPSDNLLDFGDFSGPSKKSVLADFNDFQAAPTTNITKNGAVPVIQMSNPVQQNNNNLNFAFPPPSNQQFNMSQQMAFNQPQQQQMVFNQQQQQFAMNSFPQQQFQANSFAAPQVSSFSAQQPSMGSVQNNPQKQNMIKNNPGTANPNNKITSNDLLSSNLAALDSLSKYNTPQQKSSGPSMNSLMSTGPVNGFGQKNMAPNGFNPPNNSGQGNFDFF